MKITQIKKNPNNPRVIRDDKFRKLCKSITDFPEMMEKRPIVIDEDNMILGGNQRFAALKALGYKDIPNEWISVAKGWSEEKKKEFIAKDNVSFGEWDYDSLVNWDEEKLNDWGIEYAKPKEPDKPKTYNLIPFNANHILISYPLEKHQDIIDIIKPLMEDLNIEIEMTAN